VIYLTGAGVNPQTLPVLTSHPMVGVLSTPKSIIKAYSSQFKVWAADNGCFAEKPSSPFVLSEYLSWLDSHADISDRCLFATAPDVVGDAVKTWERSRPAFEPIRDCGYKVALVIQDRSEDMDLDWSAFDAVFVGGSTAWKMSDSARSVVSEARRRGMWVHAGRVNSYSRLAYFSMIGAGSADGTFLKFAPTENIERMKRWLQKLNDAPHMELYDGYKQIPH